MKLGFGLPVGGVWATPDKLLRIARHAESLGYSSLWAFQRLLYPVAPTNHYYGAPAAVWPEPFKSVLDPLVILTHIAAHTKTIRLGTSVLVMAFYSPVVLGKQLATLDVVSEGRLSVGLGIGWSVDEYEAAGVPFKHRGERADEFIQCLNALWTQDEVEFKGQFYFIPRSRIAPKPIQKPRPPLLVGGYQEAAFRRAGQLGDGYTGGNMSPAQMAQIIARVHYHAERAGRNPSALAIVSRAAFLVTSDPQGPSRHVFCGTLDEIRDDIHRYEECGVTELFLDPTFHSVTVPFEELLLQMEALAPTR